MTRTTTRTMASLAIIALLLALGTTPSLAAKAGKKAKTDEPSGPPAQVESLKGVQYRMAKSKMADRVTRIADATSDVALADGSRASGAPDWSDIAAAYVASSRMPPKLLTMMAKDYPRGVSGTFYGDQAAWQKDDRIVFVAVEMADKLPSGAEGQQVEVGLGGDAATPLQAGQHLDTRIGVERFSLSGLFSNGAYATGSTDVSGREPGGSVEYYNTEAGIFGFYEPRAATWYLVIPRAADTDSVTIGVRSSTDAGEVLDRLELPGGGHFVDLEDASGGWGKGAGLPLLACRSLETFSGASGAPVSDPDASLIRYTAGMDPTHDAEETAALLAPAIEVMGTLPVELLAVGREEAPLIVDGELAVAPDLNAVSLTFEAPAGQWRFALADELVTPAGERVVDHTSLTGAAGVRTGPGLDGLVAGDLDCAMGGSEPAATDEDPAADSAAEGAEEPAEAAEETEG